MNVDSRGNQKHDKKNHRGWMRTNGGAHSSFIDGCIKQSVIKLLRIYVINPNTWGMKYWDKQKKNTHTPTTILLYEYHFINRKRNNTFNEKTHFESQYWPIRSTIMDVMNRSWMVHAANNVFFIEIVLAISSSSEDGWAQRSTESKKKLKTKKKQISLNK